MAIFRGNTVFFDFQFLDQDKNALSVDSASLRVSYPKGRTVIEEDISVAVETNNHWTGKWESEVSDEGWVNWSAKGSNATLGIKSAGGGKLKIVANPASERVDA